MSSVIYSMFYLPSALRAIKGSTPPCGFPSNLSTLRVSRLQVPCGLDLSHFRLQTETVFAFFIYSSINESSSSSAGIRYRTRTGNHWFSLPKLYLIELIVWVTPRDVPSQLLRNLLNYEIQHTSCLSSAEYLTVFRILWVLQPFLLGTARRPYLPVRTMKGYYLVFRFRRLIGVSPSSHAGRIFGYYILNHPSYFVLAPAQTTPPYGETVACLVYLSCPRRVVGRTIPFPLLRGFMGQAPIFNLH